MRIGWRSKARSSKRKKIRTGPLRTKRLGQKNQGSILSVVTNNRESTIMGSSKVIRVEDQEPVCFEFVEFSTLVRQVWPQITLTQVLDLYCKAYSYGGGLVTTESFYIAAQETSFFVIDLDISAYSILGYTELTPHEPNPQFYNEELQLKIEENLLDMAPLLSKPPS